MDLRVLGVEHFFLEYEGGVFCVDLYVAGVEHFLLECVGGVLFVDLHALGVEHFFLEYEGGASFVWISTSQGWSISYRNVYEDQRADGALSMGGWVRAPPEGGSRGVVRGTSIAFILS